MPEPSIVALVRRRIALADIFYALSEGIIDDARATELLDEIEERDQAQSQAQAH